MDLMQETEQKYAEYMMEDAEYAFVAYGTTGRIAETAVDLLREEGYKIGLYRPISLWPFPEKGIRERLGQIKGWMSVELSRGQMVEDLRLVVNGKTQVGFYGREGGMTPEPEEVAQAWKAQFLERGVGV